MDFLKASSVGILLLCLVGCAAQQPKTITKIETVEVKVPVYFKIDRPSRPKPTKTDTSPTYLLKLIQYTKSLEVIIDEHNKKVGE